MVKLTVRDIAELAGVSKATVSRVLNHSTLVSDATRQKVQSVLQEHTFQPNIIAQHLSKLEMNSLAVIVPQIQNAFFSGVLSAVTRIADQDSLTVLCSSTDENPQKELKAAETFLRYMVKGLIIAPCLSYTPAERARLEKVLNLYQGKIVVIDRDLPGYDCNKVFFDDALGIYEATRYLLAQGHRRIACISGPKDSDQCRIREAGYIRAMRESGQTERDIRSRIYNGDFSVRTGYHQTLALFRTDPKPDAFLTCSNELSLGFLRAMHELGEPANLRNWVTVDRLEVLEQVGWKISSTIRDSRLLGMKAAEILLQKKILDVFDHDSLAATGTEGQGPSFSAAKTERSHSAAEGYTTYTLAAPFVEGS